MMETLSWLLRRSVAVFTLLFDLFMLAVIVGSRDMVEATPSGFMHYFAKGISIMLMVLLAVSILWFIYDACTKNLGTNYKH